MGLIFKPKPKELPEKATGSNKVTDPTDLEVLIDRVTEKATGSNKVTDPIELQIYIEKKNNFLKHGKMVTDSRLKELYPGLVPPEIVTPEVEASKNKLSKILLYIKKQF